MTECLTKKCPKCLIEKPRTEFGNHSRDGIRSRCKQCVTIEKRMSKSTAEGKRRYYVKNKEKIISMARAFAKANPQRIAEARRKASENLTDSFVRNLLADRSLLSSAEIPQCLIEAKREQLRLLRALKGMNHEQCK